MTGKNARLVPTLNYAKPEPSESFSVHLPRSTPPRLIYKPNLLSTSATSESISSDRALQFIDLPLSPLP